ncbi:MAG: hypothetical protein N3A72_03050 [bacterium]|nr:hypothetical protein [bacterium]
MQPNYTLILVSVVILFSYFGLINAEEQVLVASNAIVYLKVDVKSNDPGISWLFDNWVTIPRKSSIREIVAKLTPVSGIAALYPDSDPNNLQYIVILTYRQAVNNNTEFIKFIKNKLSNELGAKSNWTTYTESGFQIIYGTDTSWTKKIGYAILDHQLIIGNNLAAIQTTIQVYLRKIKHIITVPDIVAGGASSIPRRDIIIFCNNNHQHFAKFLLLREKKWKMSLLLSAEDIRSIVIEMDIINSDRLRGTMLFDVAKINRIKDVIDDAEFIGEAFRRKFIAQKIDWKSKVVTRNNYVTLEFEVGGLEPLWLELFKVGGFAIIR